METSFLYWIGEGGIMWGEDARCEVGKRVRGEGAERSGRRRWEGRGREDGERRGGGEGEEGKDGKETREGENEVGRKSKRGRT
jgi:hypothetical protein